MVRKHQKQHNNCSHRTNCFTGAIRLLYVYASSNCTTTVQWRN